MEPNKNNFVCSRSYWNTRDGGVNCYHVSEENGLCYCEITTYPGCLKNAALSKLFTSPKHRKGGLATAMVLECERIAREYNIKTLVLSVDITNMSTAPEGDDISIKNLLKFYSNLGYTQYYKNKSEIQLIKIL